MISEFVKEQKRYTQIELCKILHCSEEKGIRIIRKLKEYGVLKTVKADNKDKDLSELSENDFIVVDIDASDDSYFYVFSFVGIIVVSGCVLKCYPKYITKKEPLLELKQVVDVLEKYNNSVEQIVRMFTNNNESGKLNILAVLLYLLNDYYEYGVYSNTEEIIESNGSGEILWDKTINETFTLIYNERPYYIDLQTRKRINDEYDYFKRLHECVLTIASKELKDSDLLDIFEIAEVDLSDETLEDFGDTNAILYNIEKELNMQYNTRKQLVLKTMYAYIARSSTLNDIDGFSMFGTNSFNMVWEKVCGDILDNQLENTLGRLKLPIPLKETYNKKQKLIDYIEKPLWTITHNYAADTLIPDIISIEGDKFIIFDAKYYTAILEEGKLPKGQPGIESVTKQYLYQLAYTIFIKDHGFSVIKNCFLMPTDCNDVIDKGEVTMEMFKSLDLADIEVRLIPAHKCYECYLSGKKMSIAELEL